MMAATATTPMTTPAAMPATFVWGWGCGVGVLEAGEEASEAGCVTMTVWPGATLVTTEGVAVVDGVDEEGGCDVDEEASEVEVDEPDELEALTPALGTLDSVPVRNIE